MLKLIWRAVRGKKKVFAPIILKVQALLIYSRVLLRSSKATQQRADHASLPLSTRPGAGILDLLFSTLTLQCDGPYYDWQVFVHLERLSKRVWTVLDLGDEVNAGFVATGAGAVVFDTGATIEQGTQLRKIVEEQTGEDVAFVINSHYHRRHCSGNGAFDTTFLFHRESYECMSEEGLANTGNPNTTHIVFTKDGMLKIGSVVFELRQAMGHSPGSLVLSLPGERVAFAGDLLFVNHVPTTTHSDLKKWASEMAWLEKIPVDTWVPGHGQIGCRDDIRVQRQYLEGLISSTTMLKRAGIDVEDILARGEIPLLGTSPGCPHHRRNMERAFRQVA